MAEQSSGIAISPGVSIRGWLPSGAIWWHLVRFARGKPLGAFGAIVAVLFGFQLALIAVAASFSRSGEFERLARIVPAAFRPAVSPALTSFGNMTAFGYFDAIIVLIVVGWAIYAASEPASDVELGLVDLIVARPVPRHRLMTRSMVVAFGSTLAVTLAMGLGTLVGLLLLAPPGIAWPERRMVTLLIAHLTLVAWCLGAATLAVSGWMRRRASTIAVVAIAAMVLYLIDLLGLWWTPMRTLARLSPFSYFHGGPIVAGTSDPIRDLSVLGLATIVATGIAYWRFDRRDF